MHHKTTQHEIEKLHKKETIILTMSRRHISQTITLGGSRWLRFSAILIFNSNKYNQNSSYEYKDLLV